MISTTSMAPQRIALFLIIGMVAFGSAYFMTSRSTEGAPTSSTKNSSVIAEGVRCVEAIPFTLSEPATHWWRAERPAYRRGVLLVLRADPDRLTVRQTATPVLFVGAETVARLDSGNDAGVAVGIVPMFGNVTTEDLLGQPMFFGPTKLAEQVTKAEAEAERDAALGRQETVLDETTMQQVLKASIHVKSEADLFGAAADLLERHAPAETDQIRMLRGR